MIRLVASDMDGTLLDESGTISPGNREAIKLIQEMGVNFIICTGRDYEISREVVSEAGIVCDFLCGSGASLHTTDGSHSYAGSLIPADLLERTLAVFEQFDMFPEMYSTGGRITNKPEDVSLDYFRSGWSAHQVAGGMISDMDSAKKIVDWLAGITRFDVDPMSLYRETESGVYKIVTSSADLEKLDDFRAAVRSLGGLAVESSFPLNVEITLHGVQKGPAVARYASQRNILPAEIMVIGDSNNDLSMMDMGFGYAVAMENASPEMKKLASHHTLKNSEDGVAHIIREFIINPASQN